MQLNESFDSIFMDIITTYERYAMDREIIATFFRNYQFAFHGTKYTIDILSG